MNIINDLDETHLSYWSGRETEVRTFTAPDEISVGIEPAVGVVTEPTDVADLNMPTVRVAWRPSGEDLRDLQEGGCIWLSCWGGLPPHMLEVQPPPWRSNTPGPPASPTPPPGRKVG